MKKIFKKLTAIIMACCCSLLVYGCDCEHVYTSEVTKEATCGEVGVKTYTCTECGEAYTEEIAKLTAHAYTDEVTKEATCTATGIRTYTCSVCGDTYSEGMARLEHKYTSKITQNPTCGEMGCKTFTCDICNNQYNESIPSTGAHSFTSSVTKKATCKEEGILTYSCIVCGYMQETPIEKNNDHSYTMSITKEATSTAPGEKTYTCEICETTYTKSFYLSKVSIIGLDYQQVYVRTYSGYGTIKVSIGTITVNQDNVLTNISFDYEAKDCWGDFSDYFEVKIYYNDKYGTSRTVKRADIPLPVGPNTTSGVTNLKLSLQLTEGVDYYISISEK